MSSDSVDICRAAGVYYHQKAEGVQPDLKAEVEAVCKARYRRIDRYTQLALLGAAHCAGTLELEPTTALYVASGKGPAEKNISLQVDIIRDRQVPKPIQFINSVSNSASFYIMKDHALMGQNLSVSREAHAFEAALEHAVMDITAGKVPAALVGMVDEITHPANDQCQRLGLSRNTPLGEGSYWMLLTPQSQSSKQRRIGSLDYPELYTCKKQLFEVLSQESDPVTVFFGHGVDDSLRHSLLTCLPAGSPTEESAEHLWDGINAGAMVKFLTSESPQHTKSMLVLGLR